MLIAIIELLQSRLRHCLLWCSSPSHAPQVHDIATLNQDLGIFSHWYNHIRPHQNLNGQTPAEVWHGIDPYKTIPKRERWFTAWDGLLTGYDLR